MSERPHVTFYTKRGCHLCDEAKREIEAAGMRGRYSFEEVDIEGDPALRRLYGAEIPVIKINGPVEFKHRLTAHDFKRAIEDPPPPR